MKKIKLLSMIAFAIIILQSCKSPNNDSGKNKNIVWANRTITTVVFDCPEKIMETFAPAIRIPDKQYSRDKRFIDILFDELEKGNMKAYQMMDDTKPMTLQEVKDLGHSVDTILFTDPVTLEESYKIIQDDLDKASLIKFKVMQDWHYNNQSHILSTKFIGIAPIRSRYDAGGNYLGDEVLFWVYFSDKELMKY